MALNRKNIRNYTNKNELNATWKKADVFTRIIISALGVFIALYIPYLELNTQKIITEQTVEAETHRTELTTKIAQSQLTVSLISQLSKGDARERKMAMEIIKHTDASQEFINAIASAIALSDPDKNVRMIAIDVLKEKGRSQSTQEVLKNIKKSGQSQLERDAATIAQEEVEIRIQSDLNKGLKLARSFYETGLYQSAAFEFKKLEKLLAKTEIDEAQLELARVAYNMNDFKTASEYYLKSIKEQKQP